MVRTLRYDLRMSWLRVISFAILASLVFLLSVKGSAQVSGPGVAASVTSHGFGGQVNHSPGVPASVTAHGGIGPFQHNNQFLFSPNCCINPLFPTNPNPLQFRHHPRHGGGGVAWGVPVYVPYYGYDYSDNMAEQDVNEQAQQEAAPPDKYLGGPTIFDRRGAGADEYVPMKSAARADTREQSSAPEPSVMPQEEQPATPQTPTILVFKDGHQMEVANYAIVGSTLIDLTAGHPRKIALADLDLDATAKQNDDRGVDFKLPVTPRS